MRLKNRLSWALFPKVETQARKVRPADWTTLPARRPSGPRRVLRLLDGPRPGWLERWYQWVAATVARRSPPR
jgi:hypothetical protein